MITEEYCSFEVAKLLKEKGFDEYCLKNYWSTDKELHDWNWELSYHRNSDGNRNTKDCAAPTHQMAMKWLREVHNLYINIFVTWRDKIPHYQWSIDNLITQDTSYDTPCLEKYEEACEAAIKYCLENLI